jgi:hypothetical protein
MDKLHRYISGFATFIPGNPEHNFAVLQRLVDEQDIGLLPVTQVHMDRGTAGSAQSCAAVYSVFDHFGGDCHPRVDKKGGGVRLTNPCTRFRYTIPLRAGFSPKAYDEGNARPGMLLVSNVTVKPCDDTSKRDPEKHKADAKAWKARVAYKRGPQAPRQW